MIRVGQGVDVHGFSEDASRPLVLGGVRITGEPGLAGHSDADVVLHAITDAVLGAGALGDLGSLVGVDLPATRDADSADFLRRAVALLHDSGLVLGNVDATILAQRPRLAPHVPAMRAAVASAAGLDLDQVSVKVTTTDRLGFLGRAEGIACTAVALVSSPAADVTG